MGKRQHQSDKMYITSTEWANEFGGKKQKRNNGEFKRLPFDCCALTFHPFEHPVASPSGVCYELLNIIPYLKKYGTDPTTGEKLTPKGLTRLHFSKNGDGKYHCPVTFKVFNENTRITAIGTTGNVYAFDAIDSLCIKVKNWKDLLDDTPFARKDLVHIQDPTDVEKHNLTRFHHLKNNLKVNDAEEMAARAKPSYNIKASASEASTAIQKLYASEASWKGDHAKAGLVGSSNRSIKLSVGTEAAPKDKLHAARESNGQASRSFTSTHLTPRTTNVAAIIDDDTVRYAKIKSKGYVRVTTNLGTMNLELRCDLVPKTCENFLKHCRSGYYNKTIFHRSIKHFMIQGGDPTGTGKGGESAFDGGAPIKDEFAAQLTHTGRGVLSMANSGPDTNKSQFFITYRSCRHLDKKHSVFGSLVGGMPTLDAFERIETGDGDTPVKEIQITEIKIFVDPFQELADAEKADVEKAAAAKQKELDQLEIDKQLDKKVPVTTGGGVGKYLKKTTPGKSASASASSSSVQVSSDPLASLRSLPATSKKKPSSKGFGNFSGW